MRTMQLSVLKRIDNLLAKAMARSSAGFVSGNLVGSPAGGVTPDNLTASGTETVVAALDLTPVLAGVFHFDFKITYTLSAADTVTWRVKSIPAVTAITGGAAVGGLHYSAGSPVVVAGGTPVLQFSRADELATGNIAKVSATLSGIIQLTGSPEATRQAIEITAQTGGGANLTTVNLSTAANEIG